MRNHRPTLLALSLLSVLAACAINNPALPPPPAPEPDLFQGAWASNCVEGQNLALTSAATLGITQRTSMVINESQITETSLISSRTCDSSDIRIESVGTTERFPTAKKEIVAINVKMGTHTITPITEYGVRVLNIAKWCGLDSWTLNQSVDVTANVGKEKCLKTTALGSVYSIEGDSLFFGAEQPVSSTSTDRALELKRNFFFTKNTGSGK